MLARLLRAALLVCATCAVSAQSSLPDPREVPGPKEGDFTGVTRDGGGQGTGGLDPVTYYADISISGWTPSNAGFTAGGAGVTMQYDLSTTMFPEAIRSQGECNSCWALTATEHFQAVLTATQSLPPLPTGENARLSAQEVIDCDAEDDGCDGGRPPRAFDFLSHHGINLGFEYTYPVNGQKQECAPIVQMPYQGGGTTYFASPLKFLAAPCFGSCPGDVAKEQLLLDFWQNPPYTSNSTGQPVLLPLIAYVDATNWANFTGGIFDVSQCVQSGDAQSHVVQIVGYGTDSSDSTKPAQPFWLIRNTWSSYWGEDGHIRLPFGVNACGLFNYITYSPAITRTAPTPDGPNRPYP